MQWDVIPIPSILRKIKNMGRQWIQHGDNVITLPNAMSSSEFNTLATIHMPQISDVTTRGPYHQTNPMSITTKSGVSSSAVGFNKVLSLVEGGNNLRQALTIDTASGFLYIADQQSPSLLIYKISTATLLSTGFSVLSAGTDAPRCAAIAGGYLYIASYTNPIKIVKLDISGAAPVEVASITLNAGENDAVSVVVDGLTNFMYIGCQTNPMIIVKIDLSTFTRVGAISIGADVAGQTGASIDSFNGFAYFNALGTVFGKVVRVKLSDFTVSAILNMGFSAFLSSVIDTGRGYLYVGDSGSPATVYQVSTTTFTQIDSAVVTPDVLNSATIDTANGFAYFCGNNSPSIISKVALNPLAESAFLTLAAGENDVEASAIDVTRGFLYLGTNTAPIIAVKVNIAPITVQGSTTRMFVRLHGGFAFVACGETPVGTNVGGIERYEDITNTSAVGANGTARRELIAYSLNGFVYTSCGFIAAATGTTERYDPVINTYTGRTAATARNGLAGFSLNGFGFTACGAIVATDQTTVERFDDNANTHTPRNDDTARHNLTGYGLNNFGFTACGFKFVGATNVGTTTRFDDTANTHTARIDGTVRTLLAGYSMNGFGFTTCGYIAANTGTTERFDDTTNAAPTARLAATARRNLAGYSLNGFGFSVDGFIAALTGTQQRFDDIANTHTARLALVAKDLICATATNEYFVNYQVSES